MQSIGEGVNDLFIHNKYDWAYINPWEDMMVALWLEMKKNMLD